MTENQIQHEIFKWQWNNFPEYRRQFFAVPNGGLRKKSEANLLKSTGVVKGIPDMVFFNNGFTIFFELKTDVGKLSKDQQLIRQIIINNGFRFYLIRTPDQFKQIYLFEIMRTQPQTTEYLKKLESNENIQFFGLSIEKFRYQTKVFEFIFGMKCDHPINFDDICEKETQPFFIECVKKFIVLEMGESNGFYVEIKSDWTGFRKMEWGGLNGEKVKQKTRDEYESK